MQQYHNPSLSWVALWDSATKLPGMAINAWHYQPVLLKNWDTTSGKYGKGLLKVVKLTVKLD